MWYTSMSTGFTQFTRYRQFTKCGIIIYIDDVKGGSEVSTSGILKEKAIESAGGMAEFKRKSEQYSGNLRFLESQKSELIKTHDGEWIAIYNSSLVASNKNLSNLLKLLGKQGAPEEEVLIQYLSSENILTLYAK